MTKKPQLSVEDAEQFASQIRPSWELLDFEGQVPDLGVPIDAPAIKARTAGAEAKPAGATSAPDTIIEGVPTFPVSGSAEPAADKPIQPLPITAIGAPAPAVDIPIEEDVPVDALPLPPQRIDLDGKAAPVRKGTLLIGGVGADPAPASAAPEVAPAAEPRPIADVKPIAEARPAPSPAAPPGPSRAPASSRRAITPAPPAGRSRPGVTGADDDIEIPIAGPPKGLFVKVGAGLAAVIVIAIGLKIGLGSSGKDSGTTPAPGPAVTNNAATTAAAPPLTATAPAATTAAAPPPVEPPATAQATPPPSAKPKVEPPPPAPPPPAKTTPPPAKTTPPPPPAKTSPPPPKKGGGIIRETPF
ncbi:MAG: hypothetical protein U0359_11385 [Byssovorax sp.]